MSETLYVAVSPGEVWAALCDGGRAVELGILRERTEVRAGEIMLGRVAKLRPDLPAALVELGLDRPAFLSAEDTPQRTLAGLHEGQAVVVQVTKEARGGKAVNVSMRVKAPAARLAAVERARASARPPARLEPEEPLVTALLASFAALPRRIVIDEAAAYAGARAALLHRGEDGARLELHRGREPLFDSAGIGDDVAAALAPRVSLAGGASLAIERTAAAVLIDVDSGGAPMMATNLRAAREAARQIRLRNLAGPIVIDFITMKDRVQRERVAKALAEAAADDPMRPQILGWTRLGHVELVRKRSMPALDEILYEPGTGAPRKTALTVAFEALRALARERATRDCRIAVAPEVAAILRGGAAGGALAALAARLLVRIEVIAEAGRARDSFDIAPA